MEKAVQMAWTFINDSFCLTLCLQYDPEIIAIAVFCLACKWNHLEFDWEPPGGRCRRRGEQWYDQFVSGLTTEILEGALSLFSAFYSSAWI